jgi:hypothetical protein
MVRDEAPAATSVASTEGIGSAVEPGSADAAELNSPNGPASLVAAEIHLGQKPAGDYGGWLHCNIQVACHPALKENIVKSMIYSASDGTRRRLCSLLSGKSLKN